MTAIRTDASLEQIANGATLPGIVKAAPAMPDIHQGYGLPVGGVAATDASDGVVSPGAIGFDINCGVRLLRTGLDVADVTPRIPALVDALYAAIPTGVGARSTVSLSARDLAAVMEQGAAWAVGRGHGEGADLERIESGGRRRAPRATRSPRERVSAGFVSWARWARVTTSSSCRWWTRSTTSAWRRDFKQGSARSRS